MKKTVEYLIFFIMILVAFSLLGGAGIFATGYYVFPEAFSTFIIMIIVLIAVPRWTIKLINLWFT